MATSETTASMAARVLGELQHVFSTEARLGGATTDVSTDVSRELTDEVVRAKRNRIVLHGVGREGLMMRAFAMRLFHLGLDAHCLGDMTCPPVGPGDLFLASAGPGSFSSVDALMTTARDAGARVVVVTAQCGRKASSLAHKTVWLPAQTMADDQVSKGGGGELAAEGASQTEKILPMGSVYEGAMFVLFEITVFMLRKELEESAESMRARHTNLE